MNLKYASSRSGVAIVLLVSILAAGCPLFSKKPDLFEAVPVKSHRDLGTIHVSLLPPVPFDAYRTQLQPRFELSEAGALAEVLPVTRALGSADTSSVSTGISVGLPTKSTTQTVTQTTEDGETTSKDERETKRVSGSPADVDPAPIDKRIATTAGTPTAPAGTDPFKKYADATALFQYVKLINNYYRDLTVDQKKVPYILRVRLTALPRVRNAQFDAFVDLSFFLDAGDDRWPLTVLPVLLSESSEQQSATRSAEEIRQLSLALEAAVKGVGAKVGADTYRQLLRSAVGRDLNGVVTVGHITQSTIRVRLGGLYQASAEYAMVPRAYDLSLLILPGSDNLKQASGKEPGSKVSLLSRVSFLDSKGLALPDTVETSLDDRVLKLLAEHDYRLGASAQAADVVSAVRASDFRQFHESVEPIRETPIDPCPTPPAPVAKNPKFPLRTRSQPSSVSGKAAGGSAAKQNTPGMKAGLWFEIARLLAEEPDSGAYVDIQLPQAPVVECEKRIITLVDDGTKTSAVIPAKDLRAAGRVVADLRLTPEGSGVVALLAERDEAADGSLKLRFPSLVSLGLDRAALKSISIGIGEADAVDCTQLRYLSAKGVSKPVARLKDLTGNMTIAVLTDAKGKLAFEVEKFNASEKTFLKVAGGIPAMISGPVALGAKNQINANGRYNVEFENVVPDQEIQISLITEAGLESDTLKYKLKK